MVCKEKCLIDDLFYDYRTMAGLMITTCLLSMWMNKYVYGIFIKIDVLFLVLLVHQ